MANYSFFKRSSHQLFLPLVNAGGSMYPQVPKSDRRSSRAANIQPMMLPT